MKSQEHQSHEATKWTYELAGVDVRGESEALSRLVAQLRPTLSLRTGVGRPSLDIGHFANVVQITDELGIAICTDGVGTKLLVAQMINRYDTVGVDCIAMNVNDLLCVGAEPIAFVDYIAVEQLSPGVVEQIGRGLAEGARQANISIVGGELAQLREMVRGMHPGAGFDIAGTAIGLVELKRIIVGQDVTPGDVVIGLTSSGIHSNGLTLARRIFFDQLKWSPDYHCSELGCTIAEALLTPTRIYVKPIMALLRSGVKVKALLHITGGGWLNMLRTQVPAHLHIDNVPQPSPIFKLIQQHGNVPIAEMYAVFNMGIGFAIIVSADDADCASSMLCDAGEQPITLGAVHGIGERMLTLAPLKLTWLNGEWHYVA